MENNNKQNILTGFDATIRSLTFSDHLHDLIARHSLTTIANELDIDKAALSRFKNGDGNLGIADIEKILKFDGIILIPKQRLKRIVRSLITMSELLKESLGW